MAPPEPSAGALSPRQSRALGKRSTASALSPRQSPSIRGNLDAPSPRTSRQAPSPLPHPDIHAHPGIQPSAHHASAGIGAPRIPASRGWKSQASTPAHPRIHAISSPPHESRGSRLPPSTPSGLRAHSPRD
jgi:hypothetical protein